MKTIIWKGIAYTSLEYFTLKKQEHIFMAHSRIIGSFEDTYYHVEYDVLINSEWKAIGFDIKYEVNDIKKEVKGKKIDELWELNGSVHPEYTGFDFIDISLSPFTNTLPIRNLHLRTGQELEPDVMYLNILEDYIQPVKQRYRKNTDGTYRYQNVPNNFEAAIRVDESGFVVHYPSLFERIKESATSI